jgi:hypothetical protein
MANFVLLYSGGSMRTTEAEHAAVLQAWETGTLGLEVRSWMQEIRSPQWSRAS